MKDHQIQNASRCIPESAIMGTGLGESIYQYFMSMYEILKTMLMKRSLTPRQNAKIIVKDYIKKYGK